MHKLAGKKAPKDILVNVADLVTQFFTKKIEFSEKTKVSFGTSGHRGSSLNSTFNEAHILAITQAVVDYRKEKNINGPLFIGMDTHALSIPAHNTALRVLAANKVYVNYAENFKYTPTPVVSYAILTHKNSDGIVVTPSHNPPSDGGFKYNSIDGGPANEKITKWIEDRANEILKNNLKDVKVISLEEALNSGYLQEYDFITPYVKHLKDVIDIEAIQKANLKIGVDAMGGSGIDVYKAIKKEYNLNMDIMHDWVDFTFSFMHLDKDGKIRMDCSSPYAMAGLLELKDKYDIAFGNDTDFDRHGIVTKEGLVNPNHYLAVAIDYLSKNRNFKAKKIGKTLVSSSIIDRVCEDNNIEVYETPVGFKWFVEPMIKGEIFFGGEESAGASFLRKDNTPWSTDKDGIIMNLLAVEITAKVKDISSYYKDLTDKFGNPIYKRIDAPADSKQKQILKNLTPQDIKATTLAGEKIIKIITKADNGAKIGGLKVVAENGWFAIRPSGTEDIYKIYAESFIDESHLEKILQEAQQIANELFEGDNMATKHDIEKIKQKVQDHPTLDELKKSLILEKIEEWRHEEEAMSLIPNKLREIFTKDIEPILDELGLI